MIIQSKQKVTTNYLQKEKDMYLMHMAFEKNTLSQNLMKKSSPKFDKNMVGRKECETFLTYYSAPEFASPIDTIVVPNTFEN